MQVPTHAYNKGVWAHIGGRYRGKLLGNCFSQFPKPLYYWHLLVGHGVGIGKRLQYGRRVYQMEFCSNTYRHFVPKPLYYWHLLIGHGAGHLHLSICPDPHPLHHWRLLAVHGVGTGKRLRFGRRT